MTKRERAQVVELLRCAADENDPLDTYAFMVTLYQLGRRVECKAHLWSCMALQECAGRRGDDWRHACLEAAARVEEGSYP